MAFVWNFKDIKLKDCRQNIVAATALRRFFDPRKSAELMRSKWLISWLIVWPAMSKVKQIEMKPRWKIGGFFRIRGILYSSKVSFYRVYREKNFQNCLRIRTFLENQLCFFLKKKRRDWFIKNETGIFRLERIKIIWIFIKGTLVTIHNNDSEPSLASFWTLDLRPSIIKTIISWVKNFSQF